MVVHLLPQSPKYLHKLILLASQLLLFSRLPPRRQKFQHLLLPVFGAIYPGATDVIWTIKDRSYEVAFNFKQTEFKVLFLEDGSVERTKTKVEISTLPEGVTNYARGRNLTEALRVIDGFGTVTWEVKIGDVKYLFTQKGELLGQLP